MSKGKLVVGLGNVLMRDDGTGVQLVRQLRSLGIDGEVRLLEGATLGFDILDEIEGYEKVVIVDAVDMGKEPGHVAVFDAERLIEQESGKKFSAHEIGLIEVLQVAKRIGYSFGNVTVVGIQPAEVCPGCGITEPVRSSFPEAVERILILLGINHRVGGKDDGGKSDS
ncbi:MAG: hydrogenase maturation protease [Candidatus Hadarchaeales archaeon]